MKEVITSSVICFFPVSSLMNERNWCLKKMGHRFLWTWSHGELVAQSSRGLLAVHYFNCFLQTSSFPVGSFLFFPNWLCKCVLYIFWWFCNHWPSKHPGSVLWSCFCFWLEYYWNSIVTIMKVCWPRTEVLAVGMGREGQVRKINDEFNSLWRKGEGEGGVG